MGKVKNSRGLSLAEAILAMFIMVFGFAIMTRLFNSALRYQANTDSQQVASVLAESMMEKVRGWNWNKHKPGSGTPFSDWSLCPGMPGGPDPNNPAFNVAVTGPPTYYPVYNPCSSWETLYPAGAQRVMSSSACWVRVTVTWASHLYYLESLIGAPPANVTSPPSSSYTLGVSPSSPPNLAYKAVEPFSVQVTDPSSNALDDVFAFYFLLGTGDGTVVGPASWTALTPPRDAAVTTLSQGVILHNYMSDPLGNIIGEGNGTTTMAAYARARGLLLFNQTSQFNL